MSFVNHEDGVFGQEGVDHSFAEQHAVCKIFDAGAVWRAEILEADGVADLCSFLPEP